MLLANAIIHLCRENLSPVLQHNYLNSWLVLETELFGELTHVYAQRSNRYFFTEKQETLRANTVPLIEASILHSDIPFA